VRIDGSTTSATGDTFGLTPTTVSLEPGDYRVAVSLEGWIVDPGQITAEVLGTRSTEVAFTLRPGEALPALVAVSAVETAAGPSPRGDTVAGLSIWVDGIDSGEITPATFEVEPGSHLISLGDPEPFGFYSVGVTEIEVDALSGETVAAAFELAPGYLQRVIVEDITNASCDPCPPAEERLLNVLDDYDRDRVFSIHLHSNSPGYDPMYWANPLEYQARWSYYQLSGNPFFFVNGVKLNGTSEEEVSESIESALAEGSPALLSASFAVAGDSVSVDVRVRSVADVPGDWRLLVITIQNHIAYEEPPGSNGQSDFIRPIRDFVPNHPGDPITLTAGMDETRSYRAGLLQAEHAFANPADDPDQVAVVAVLQEVTTREILQATATGIIE
jgi:hypothetical protein